MSARWFSLGVWALVSASALFWGLRLFVKPPQAPPQTQLAEPATGLRGDLSRLLGADPPPPVVSAEAEPQADARFALIGVVSPRSSRAAREGLALIAVDGGRPKAYRVGAVVDGDQVLKAVSARSASLGPRDGAVQIALDLVPVAAASTGSLPALPVEASPTRATRRAGQRLPQQQPAVPQQQVPGSPTPLATPQVPTDPDEMTPGATLR